MNQGYLREFGKGAVMAGRVIETNSAIILQRTFDKTITAPNSLELAVFMMPDLHTKIKQVSFVSNGTITANNSNYWSIDMLRRGTGSGTSVLSSATKLQSNLTQFNAYARAVMDPDQNLQAVNTFDVYTIKISSNNTPTPFNNLLMQVELQRSLSTL